jgi:NADH-quinone oxidoreductase subunit J
MEATIFYILAAVTVVATVFAITERHTVHAIVYLVTSFFALAVIFYLLGAPLVAVFEVIIYAGAIMVLFLFVIMMLDLGHPEKVRGPALREWWPALLLGTIILAATATLLAAHPPPVMKKWGYADIRQFSRVLFREYGIAVEVVSMQLLFALVGALYLGKRR